MAEVVFDMSTVCENEADYLPEKLQELADEFVLKYYNARCLQPIYHYTSPEGLLGIVKDKGIVLRFTRYDCVNDLSEGKDVIRCYELACFNSLKSGSISKDFYDSIKNIELDVSAVDGRHKKTCLPSSDYK